MRFIQYLQEEYLAREKNNEIFVNPTTKELTDLGKLYNGFVRYAADFKNHNLYVFVASMIHSYAERVLQSNNINVSWFGDGFDWTALGTAKVVGGKLKFYRSDTGRAFTKMEQGRVVDEWAWPKKSDKWLNRWFGPGHNKTYLKACRAEEDVDWV